MTSDLMYKYQVPIKDKDQVLLADRDKNTNLKQVINFNNFVTIVISDSRNRNP